MSFRRPKGGRMTNRMESEETIDNISKKTTQNPKNQAKKRQNNTIHY
jgi:hypothetical protein